ncbi:MAG: PfkB family carbohydrate kinase [Lachnospiraceae bacterium]|nr:PfkB family carbohydrate kinase [Lachnospiraceae bacterium]
MNIKDIAGLCGVSSATVSKILNHKDDDISAETRKKVLKIIKEYQYVPYSKIINSVPNKNHLIGVLLSKSTYGVQEMLYRIGEIAGENGYSVIMCNIGEDDKGFTDYVHILENKGVNGIITICMNDEIPEDIKIPVVRVSKKKNVEYQNETANVYCDMKDAGYLATMHLFNKGHRRIAFLLEPGDQEVSYGYIKAYKEKFISPEEEWCFFGTEEEICKVGIESCLGKEITAVICSNVEIGCALYEKIRKQGGSIPEKISVISVRDNPFAEKMYPALTTIKIPLEKMGEKAVEELIERIEGDKQLYECTDKIDLYIQERDSVISPNEVKGEKIVVVGSMNMDCIINVSHIPTDGETVKTRNIVSFPGGKGANQAAGAGKLNGMVYMIGRLGNDREGKEIYNSLVDSGVRMDGVVFDERISTGRAYINVAQNGESTIVIYPGANDKLDRNQIRQYDQILDNAKYCLLSLEISEETVEYAIRKCKKKNVEVILKPSSVEKMKESLFEKIDYFIPNEKEVKQLIPGDTTIEEKAAIIMEKGVKNVIITLGHKGCFLKNSQYERYFPAADFYPVDTTGAADAFISALAVSLSENNNILQAISFATYAAGISITRQGVQPALIDRAGLSLYREDIDTFI